MLARNRKGEGSDLGSRNGGPRLQIAGSKVVLSEMTDSQDQNHVRRGRSSVAREAKLPAQVRVDLLKGACAAGLPIVDTRLDRG